MTSEHRNLRPHTRSVANRGRRRAGFSLVEMVVVVGLSTLLMGIVVSLMFGLREWDRLSRVNSVRNEQLLRLAGVLREDIRSGSEVHVADDGPLVVLTASGEQSRYELRPEGCVRTVAHSGEAERLGDLFAVGVASRWIVKQESGGRRPLVEVTIEAKSASDSPDKRRLLPFLVYAALGADLAAVEPPIEQRSTQ
jgi:type II secretory pathway component PulJ